MKIKNEIVQELKEKIQSIEQDPIKFTDTIDVIDKYITEIKINRSSKYDKACKSIYECTNCKNKFLRENAKPGFEVSEQNKITYCSPWGDDVGLEKHRIKTLYYTCPHCGYKNFYDSEDLGSVNEVE